MSDLDVIDGGGMASVTIGGQAYEFGALKVGKIPAFARALRPMGEAVGSLMSGQSFNVGTLLDLLADHGDNVIEAVSIATGIPRDVIADSEPDEMLPAAVAAFEVNRDFFVRRLVPALRAALKPAASPGAGPTA